MRAGQRVIMFSAEFEVVGVDDEGIYLENSARKLKQPLKFIKNKYVKHVHMNSEVPKKRFR